MRPGVKKVRDQWRFLGLLAGVTRDQSGASLIEVTLIFPLALSLMAGLAAFGHGLYAYHTSDKAVRVAARYLARVPEVAIDTWGIENATDILLKGCILDSSKTYCRGDILQRPMKFTVPQWEDSEWGTTGVLNISHDVEDVTSGGQTVRTVVVTADAVWPIFGGMAILGIPSSIGYRISHREPHIGE